VPRTGSWGLQQRLELIQLRAEAQLKGEIQRPTDGYTLLMPPRADVRLFLVVDADPIDNDLVTLGYRRWRRVDGKEETEEVVRVLAKSHPDEESDALRSVLGAVAQDLSETDAWNRTHPENPLIAQIFLYEAAEAKNLQQALGRNLRVPEVRRGLLDLLRIFPPEEIVPEPEFKSYQHLPATIVRHVLEQLFALPVLVSYDLRQVTQVLASAQRPLQTPYRPQTGFERRFSSLLSIDVIRTLREGRLPPSLVENDVKARLAAVEALADWLFEENASSIAPFLRLPKQPFRFLRTMNPLEPGDLEILQAYTLLEERSTMLSHLTRMAQSASRRRLTLRTIDGLRYMSNTKRKNTRLVVFSIPPDCVETELVPDTFDVILTQDEPDIRLNPLLWTNNKVTIQGIAFERHPPQLVISMLEARFQAIVAPQIGQSGQTWCLDEVYQDRTAVRLHQFLSSLAPQADGAKV